MEHLPEARAELPGGRVVPPFDPLSLHDIRDRSAIAQPAIVNNSEEQLL